jgi:alcohol dehydrogenase class IV
VLDELGAVVSDLGARRVLLVTDAPVVAAGIVTQAVAVLDTAGVRSMVFDGAKPNPAREHVECCRDVLVSHQFDAVVGIGGGSAIDVAKASVALHAASVPLPGLYGLGRAPRRGVLPVVAVPTTPCTGAEVSAHATIADAGRKHAISSPALVPAATVVQPSLCATLPWESMIACALDGFLHAVEAYLARGATPFTDTFAIPATRLIAAGLDRVVSGDLGGLDHLSLGCLHAGIAMANANAGLVHALGYPLTTHHNIPHGLANALVAPVVLAASRSAHPDRDSQLARALSAPTLADVVHTLRTRAGVADGLRTHGIHPADIPTLADQALTYRPIRNNWPYSATRDDIEAMYQAAM